MEETPCSPPNLCLFCQSASDTFVCDCLTPPICLCIRCLPSHIESERYHKLLSIPAQHHRSFFDCFQKQKEKQRFSSIAESSLSGNIPALQQWTQKMTECIDEVIVKLEAVRDTIRLEMTELMRETESAIQEGIAKFRENINTPQRELTNPIAKALWSSPGEKIRLFSCQTDFEAVKRSVNCFIFSLNLHLQAEIPHFHPYGTIAAVADINPNRKVNIYHPLSLELASAQCSATMLKLNVTPKSKDLTPTVARGAVAVPNIGVYVGEWSDTNRFHGFGTFWSGNGSVYRGQFANNCYSGLGVYIFGNGEAYVGQRRDDKKHGLVKHILTDGKVEIEEWTDGYKVIPR